jgi:Trk K+ transport system NAD-binding subunit
MGVFSFIKIYKIRPKKSEIQNIPYILARMRTHTHIQIYSKNGVIIAFKNHNFQPKRSNIYHILSKQFKANTTIPIKLPINPYQVSPDLSAEKHQISITFQIKHIHTPKKITNFQFLHRIHTNHAKPRSKIAQNTKILLPKFATNTYIKKKTMSCFKPMVPNTNSTKQKQSFTHTHNPDSPNTVREKEREST